MRAAGGDGPDGAQPTAAAHRAAHRAADDAVVFQCFEGISLVCVLPPQGPAHHEIVGLEPLHHQVIRLLGPHCEKRYELGA